MYLSSPKTTWSSECQREMSAIRSACGNALQLHHIDSTAVAGLYAKDCLYILGVTPDLAALIDQHQPLKTLGYEFRGEYGLPGRAYYHKARRKVHLHIYQAGHPSIKPHLRFVAAMNRDPALRAELNQLKLALHNPYPDDKAQYQAAKAHFYQQFSTPSTHDNNPTHL
ncbi:GrpB family protein [Marinicella meishanensis]|uniref:GrpB family protein n=1 Tax=Marinicella meishanensis TaxID=2873263 RepID=UPI001CBC234C|nr:GrpB family protein [Marinicella sp. NBU2979]